MKLRLAEYKEGDVVEVLQDYNPVDLDVEFIDLKYSGPIKLEGTVEKGEVALVFRGRLTSEIENICGRCLKQIKNRIDQPFDLYYEIKGQEFIDTTDDIREALILDHPITFVCQDNCKGLCAQCGANLNETQADLRIDFTPL